jgi:hypothetical protein
MKQLSIIFLGVMVLTITACTNNKKHVSKGDYGQDWPFSVESGTVQCVGDELHIIFKADGSTYALNEAAKSSGEYDDVEDIIRSDANYPGRKIMMDLSAIEFEGLKLCNRN